MDLHSKKWKQIIANDRIPSDNPYIYAKYKLLEDLFFQGKFSQGEI